MEPGQLPDIVPLHRLHYIYVLSDFKKTAESATNDPCLSRLQGHLTLHTNINAELQRRKERASPSSSCRSSNDSLNDPPASEVFPSRRLSGRFAQHLVSPKGLISVGESIHGDFVAKAPERPSSPAPSIVDAPLTRTRERSSSRSSLDLERFSPKRMGLALKRYLKPPP
jgi:hypothetical protein